MGEATNSALTFILVWRGLRFPCLPVYALGHNHISSRKFEGKVLECSGPSQIQPMSVLANTEIHFTQTVLGIVEARVSTINIWYMSPKRMILLYMWPWPLRLTLCSLSAVGLLGLPSCCAPPLVYSKLLLPA